MRKVVLLVAAMVSCLTVHSQNEAGYVALTFDDGPSLTVTPLILDVLEEYGATATFFVRGNRIDEETSLVMIRASSMGCEIGNHSWSHPHFSKQTEERIKSEIMLTDSVIEKYTGKAPLFLRPPFYDWDERVTAVTDMTLIGGFCPNDFRDDTSVQQRIDLTLENVSDGIILLFHDSSKNQMTAEAIKTIVPELIARGYTFVTLSDLFRLRYPDGKWKHDFMYHRVP